MKNSNLSDILLKRKPISSILFEKKKIIVDVIAALFILLFFYTAISKSSNINYTVTTLNSVPIFKPIASAIAWGIIVSEYLIAALLFFPQTKKIGLYSSLILMIVFTVYLGYMITFIPKLPCSCGGIIQKMTWNQHLVFNLFFTLLAWIGVWLSGKTKVERGEAGTATSVVFT